MSLAIIAIWSLLTLGLNYLVTRAAIFSLPRALIVARFPVLADLLSCDRCSSFWTGQVAACFVLSQLQPPWHAWIYWPPVAGLCAIGLVDLLSLLAHKQDDSDG